MLQSPVPIVSTSEGCLGLPHQIASLIRIADVPGDFAREIVGAIDDRVDREEREVFVDQHFGETASEAFILSLSKVANLRNLA